MVTVYLGSLRLPAAPESIRFLVEGGGTMLKLLEPGEVTLPGKGKRRQVTFSGYLPGRSEKERFPFCKERPEVYARQLESYLESGKAIRFSVSGGVYPCSFAVTVEQCDFTEEAGNEGLLYTLKLREYRSMEGGASGFVSLNSSGGSKRPDLREREETVLYTVKKGDTLWAIAKRYLGDGGRYREIAADNGIVNPNLIYVGQEVKIRL